ncbi:pyridoxal phosphate-dependent aminotransferase [Methylonatrum kenyense]|uniref:pyridoxal phosphate-dependent aminotransferase n=1 Tax=Methylonatrum kenyense TaxID=455253 RepID=UPI0020BFBADE|nr:pyridoxal phosphate-dependent aminotransferase [Methylonatrum kenyense]MCK8516554.1 pyridoxal phosphate-dependent aminotransferase [Methylonatrum kenyense]
MRTLRKSHKLADVCYDIRGPVLTEATRLEDEGQRIMKLNIGNPAAFGFEAPDEILQDVIRNLPRAQGYSDARGVFAARKAVMQQCQQQGVRDVDVDDIWLGNGVSELIVMSMQALINNGDEVLIPAPDYPLWTAAVSLSGGRPVHYLCDETQDWEPDLADMEAKITEHTRGIVVINPNNPTGAVYSRETLEQIVDMARRHRLVLFADEIYDKILYDEVKHLPMASLSDDVLTISFSGLSKVYRAAGFRSGWMFLSGDRSGAEDYIEGLNILASMRLCANVPAQFAVQTALGGYQSIRDLIVPGGRLYDQRTMAYERVNAIPGLSCVKPQGALYLFLRLDPEIYPIKDDRRIVLDLLRQEHLLLVEGTAFNWPTPDHLRLVFLPHREDLNIALDRLDHFLGRLRRQYGTAA